MLLQLELLDKLDRTAKLYSEWKKVLDNLQSKQGNKLAIKQAKKIMVELQQLYMELSEQYYQSFNSV